MKPVEPMSILCHGDLVINNIFFKKEGQKVEAKLFDFGRIGYHSPSHDLATFLFFNCSNEDRGSHFNQIFIAYHEALIKYLREAGVTNHERFSKENFLEDFKFHAIATFSLPLFLSPHLNLMHTVRNDCNFNIRMVY